jgi:selenocysteine-specific translation elongation factor
MYQFAQESCFTKFEKIILVQTKSDIIDSKTSPYVQECEISEFMAERSDIVLFMKTSAKTGENVQKLFEKLAGQV